MSQRTGDGMNEHAGPFDNRDRRPEAVSIRDLDGAELLLYHGTLISAWLSDLDLRRADLRGLTMEGAHYDGSDLTDADLSGADLYWASCFEATLTRAIMRGADLRGADLSCAVLKDAVLDGANLGRDNLGGSTWVAGADFTGVNLHNTDVRGAVYDEHTVFPSGFDPIKAGMIVSHDHERKES